MYIGTDGVYTYTFEHEKRPECPVCGGEVIEVTVGHDWTLERLVEVASREARHVSRTPEKSWTGLSVDICQIKKPSLSSANQQLYFQAPPQLEEATRPNLEKKLSDLVAGGAEITVTSSSLPFSLSAEDFVRVRVSEKCRIGLCQAMINRASHWQLVEYFVRLMAPSLPRRQLVARQSDRE